MKYYSYVGVITIGTMTAVYPFSEWLNNACASCDGRVSHTLECRN